MGKLQIISLEKAIAQGDTPEHIEAIADWHAEHSKTEFDRHDMMAFRLQKLARDLREYNRFSRAA